MALFEYIEKDISVKQQVFKKTFERTHAKYYLVIKPNMKANNVKDFLNKLIEDSIEFEEQCDEEYDEEYADEENKEGFHVLGKEEFTKRLIQYYTTPIHDNCKNVYIDLSPYFIDSNDNWTHIKFNTTPSVVDLLYAHSVTWQDHYKKNNYSVNIINHHYSGIKISGDNEKIICEPLISS